MVLLQFLGKLYFLIMSNRILRMWSWFEPVLIYPCMQLATLSNRRPQERLELLRIKDTREVMNICFVHVKFHKHIVPTTKRGKLLHQLLSDFKNTFCWCHMKIMIYAIQTVSEGDANSTKSNLFEFRQLLSDLKIPLDNTP